MARGPVRSHPQLGGIRREKPQREQRRRTRAHRVHDVGRVVDDTADAGCMPAETFAIPLAFAQHDVDLFGRVPVIDVAHIGRDQGRAEPQVAAPFQPRRPDDVGIGVTVVKFRAVGFGAWAPAPPQLGLQRLERVHEKREPRCRSRTSERGRQMAVCGGRCERAPSDVADRRREGLEDAGRRGGGGSPFLHAWRQGIAGGVEKSRKRFGALHFACPPFRPTPCTAARIRTGPLRAALVPVPVSAIEPAWRQAVSAANRWRAAVERRRSGTDRWRGA